jgi:Alpha-L-fucosidase
VVLVPFDHAAHPVQQRVRPLWIVGRIAAPVGLAEALRLQVALVQYPHAELVAQVEEGRVRRVVAGAYRVDVVLLHQLKVGEHGGGGQRATEVGVELVPVDPAQQDRRSVHPQLTVHDGHGAEADAQRGALSRRVHDGVVQPRCLRAPRLHRHHVRVAGRPVDAEFRHRDPRRRGGLDPQGTQAGGVVVAGVHEEVTDAAGRPGDERDVPEDARQRMLVDTVSKGGNLLLNVGPTARGEFDRQARDALAGIGRWMRRHGRAIDGAGPSPYQPPVDCRYTQRGDRLYLHLFAWPFEMVHLAGLADRVAYAQFLHDSSEVRFTTPDPDDVPYATRPGPEAAGTLTLELPVRRPDVAIPVVELFLKG